MEYNRCPNCGKKGLFESKTCIFNGKTHRCKYCEMEFKKVISKGEICWKGDIPAFVVK